MRRIVLLTLAVTLAILLGLAGRAYGDCQSRVAQAAQDAVRTGDFSLIVVWVEPVDEPVLQDAFRRARARYALRPSADAAFAATAERLHRARSRIPCDQAVAIDRALTGGYDEVLVEAIVTQFRAGLRARLREAEARSDYGRGDIEAGRLAVASYVELVRYVTAVVDAVTAPPPRYLEPIRHER